MVCQDVPIFAVFMAYLHSAGRETELAELLKEADFGSWVSKRVRLSFRRQPAISRDLALFVSLLPMPVDFFYRLDQGRFGDLLDVLANDGWVEQLPTEEFEGSLCWATAHDVLADQIVLSYVRGISPTVERFVEEVFLSYCGIGMVSQAGKSFPAIGIIFPCPEAEGKAVTALDYFGEFHQGYTFIC